MATINMNTVQFYNPSSTAPSLSARCAATIQKYRQSTGIPHRKQRNRALESYSQSQNTGKDTAGKQDDYAGDGSIAADEDDEFLPVDEVIRRALHLEDSTEKPTTALAAQGTDETSFLDGSGSSQPGHLDGSKEQPLILNDDDDSDHDDDSNDDDSDSTSGGGISSDSNADSTGRELGPPPSPITPCPSSRPSSSRDPSLHPSAALHDQSLEGQATQQDDGCISRGMLEQPSCPAPILADNKDDKTDKGQQQQEAGKDGKQGGCDSDTSSHGDVDDEERYLRDNDKSEGLPPPKQRRLSLSCEPTIRRSRKRRLQHFNEGVSTMRSPQQHQGMGEEKDQEGHDSSSGTAHDHRDDQDSDDSEDLRPAKRRRPSPSHSDLTSKRHTRERHVYQPCNNKSHAAPVQRQVERSSAVSPRNHLQSEMASTLTSASDKERTSNISAQYQEWPMRGVFKRTIIGDEVRYGMEFSLEETDGLMCQQHTVAHDSTDYKDSQPGDLWDIQRITGMRKFNGAEEFRVAWAQTWMPESELGGAREIVEEFKARLSVQRGKKKGQGKPDVTGEKASKRQRGRPRKQA